ncbi:MAG: ABC transporter substrate-binding protein [Chloroflexi bacterium]|nr:ABC transporter substrate-binding protein [Chloroflexota bacterium]
MLKTTIAIMASGANIVQLQQDLLEHNWANGQNYSLEYIGGPGAGLSDISRELARAPVNAIVVFATPTAIVAKQATTTIPIVASMNDPVAAGLVNDLARPGGNLTGFNHAQSQFVANQVKLLKDVLPRLARVSALAEGGNPIMRPSLAMAQDTGAALGVQVRPLEVRSAEDLERAFDAIALWPADGLLVLPTPLFQHPATGGGLGERILELLRLQRLPAVFPWAWAVRSGGLACVSSAADEFTKVMARQLDLILKGANPGDLPIEQPTRYHLAINQSTAQALGITVTQSVLALANEIVP